MADLKYLPGGNPLARIRHRPESEKWRVYQTGRQWRAASPASVYDDWWNLEDPSHETCPDQHFPLSDHGKAIEYADRMARHG